MKNGNQEPKYFTRVLFQVLIILLTNYENSKVPASKHHQSVPQWPPPIFPSSKRLPRFLSFHNLQSQQRWLESGGDCCFLRVHVGARKPRGNRKNKSHDQCVTFTSPSFLRSFNQQQFNKSLYQFSSAHKHNLKH